MPKVLTSKDELIAKAIEVFSKNGYYYTSLSELAKACEIEKSHFYYYFKDKSDLMNECLIAYSKEIGKNVFDISVDETMEPKKRIKKMLGYVWKIYTENGYGCLFGNTLLETVGKEPFFEKTIRDFFEKWKNALIHLYAKTKLEGRFEEMAYEDIQKLQGSIMLMRLYKDKLFLKRAIAQIVGKF